MNGISIENGYTTLAYRLVNVSALMIAYVSMIPVIRKNVPPMPNVALIEVITYAEMVPNLLALIGSMLSYTLST